MILVSTLRHSSLLQIWFRFVKKDISDLPLKRTVINFEHAEFVKQAYILQSFYCINEKCDIVMAGNIVHPCLSNAWRPVKWYRIHPVWILLYMYSIPSAETNGQWVSHTFMRLWLWVSDDFQLICSRNVIYDKPTPVMFISIWYLQKPTPDVLKVRP